MPISILWIEDDYYTVERLEYLLKQEIDCTITFSTDATDAIHKLREHNYNLIILDIMMPPGDELPESIEPQRAGIEVLKMIRTGEIQEKLKTIPIIAVTAVSNDRDKEAVKALGVSDYLSKPVRSELLTRAVKVALGIPNNHK